MAVVKKKWYPIVSPQEFRNVVIGETMSTDPKLLLGRRVKVNYMFLANDAKRQGANITLKITEIKEDKAITQLVKYEMLGSYMRRLVKKNKDKIADSFVCKTKDGVTVRIKPMFITRNRVKSGVLAQLIKKTRSLVTDEVRKLDFKDLINALTSAKLQKGLKHALVKIYPLSVCEFSAVERQP